MNYFNRQGTPVINLNPQQEGDKPTYTRRDSCNKCGGQGGSEAWKHTGWTCYRCGGTGREEPRIERAYTAEELEKLNATAAKARATREAKQEAKYAREREALAAKLRAFDEVHPDLRQQIASANGSFFESLLASLSKHGNLTDPQIAAAKEIIARRAEEKAAKELEAAQSQHVGTVKDRIAIVGTVTSIVRYAGYDWSGRECLKHITVITDQQGNQFKYFGYIADEGVALTVKATIKEHAEYKGLKQTVVQRPKIAE